MSTTATEKVRRVLMENASADPMTAREIVAALPFPASTTRSALRRLFDDENHGQIKRKQVPDPRGGYRWGYWFEARNAELPSAPLFHLRPDKGEPWESIPMILFCPAGHRHIDEGDFAEHPHHTHACQTCGHVWRPAKVNTHGVQFLPGYRNGEN